MAQSFLAHLQKVRDPVTRMEGHLDGDPRRVRRRDGGPDGARAGTAQTRALPGRWSTCQWYSWTWSKPAAVMGRYGLWARRS
jgi:hypothetical protein